jgi:hypothetical protein
LPTRGAPVAQPPVDTTDPGADSASVGGWALAQLEEGHALPTDLRQVAHQFQASLGD